MKKSFTLIELLIVLVIVGVLATIAIPNYIQMRDKAILAEAKRCVRALADGIWLYYVEAGRWPSRWIPPPQGSDDPMACPVDPHPGISKYWNWSIESNTDPANGDQATARSKGGEPAGPPYGGYNGLVIKLYSDGKRIYGWRLPSGEWQEAPEGEAWPF